MVKIIIMGGRGSCKSLLIKEMIKLVEEGKIKFIEDEQLQYEKQIFDLAYETDITVVSPIMTASRYTEKQWDSMYNLALISGQSIDSILSAIQPLVEPMSNIDLLSMVDEHNLFKLDYEKPQKSWEKKRFYY